MKCYANAYSILKMDNYNVKNNGTYITNYILYPVRDTLNAAVNLMENDPYKIKQAQDYINNATLENVSKKYNPNTYFGEQLTAAMFVLGMGLHTIQDESAHVVDPHNDDYCDEPGWDYVNGGWQEGNDRITQAKSDTKAYINEFLSSNYSYIFPNAV